MLIHRLFTPNPANSLLAGFFSGSRKMLAVCGLLAAMASPVKAEPWFSPGHRFVPGNLIVTESVYAGTSSLITPGTTLLPNGATATADGSYPFVFNNESPDPSFGITAPIFIEQLTREGDLVSKVAVPARLLTTSFSSKSELAIHPSTEGFVFNFMGYSSPINTFDVSNSNTPNHFDSSNPVTATFQRAIGQVDRWGNVSARPVDAYSGNNGRSVILSNWIYYMVGNAGNGTIKGAQNIVDNTGVQIASPFSGAETTVVGQLQGTVGAAKGYQYGFSVTQLGLPADNSGKDDNFRGETIFNNTLFVSKGSGGNGINTVYQVGATHVLPTFASAATTQISILPGFPTALAKSTTDKIYFPFGLWFADAKTLYVADEGDGVIGNAATGTGGLQKWILVGGTWQLAYTLTAGLNLGQPYAVANYPTGINPTTGLDWAPATDGLRNIVGKQNRNGTVTIYAITSTVSGATDQGADPNRLVEITDHLSYTTDSQASGEQFKTIKTALSGAVLRGVSFVTEPSDDRSDRDNENDSEE